MTRKKIKIINRDISWLSFNERVLQEAEDPTVPIIERFKFLGIFSNNRDEFFRVRVGTLKRMLKMGKKAWELIGANPADVLEQIQKIVLKQQARFDATFSKLLKDLAVENIYIINEKQLNKEQGAFVKNYFNEFVRPTLMPVMIDVSPKFPYLKDKSIYLIMKLVLEEQEKIRYSLLEIPTDVLSRFLVLPGINQKKYIILLDDVIRFSLHELFSIFKFVKAEAYTIKITRDAELDIEQDISKSLVEKISKSLKKRKRGQPVRLVYDAALPADMLRLLMKKLNFRKEDNPIPGGRYHNFKDFMKFPNVGKPSLIYKPVQPLLHKDLKDQRSLFDVIKKKDILLYFPYQSFHHIIDLLREATMDPKVRSIQITLYRVARNSNVLNALINAVKNGKLVTVILEIQARFDEEANIYWANKLQDEGARVIFGVPGLKAHSKLFLISRIENGKVVNYAHIGTGNFNEDTALVYTDLSLLTANQKITNDVSKIFNFYLDNFKIGTYKSLVVSPFFMRKKFVHLINKEIEHALDGKDAYMILKMNSLVDHEMIRKIYEAAEKGVKVKLIVRGPCSLMTGLPEHHGNIEAISIVDKFLEHSRIFIFCNKGDEKYFISSADWMNRNLDNRSEVAAPVYDKSLQQMLKTIIGLQWNDNVKARIIDNLQENKYKTQTGKTKIRAQEEIYKYLKEEG
jgi:polyphosphate kinase